MSRRVLLLAILLAPLACDPTPVHLVSPPAAPPAVEQVDASDEEREVMLAQLGAKTLALDEVSAFLGHMAQVDEELRVLEVSLGEARAELSQPDSIRRRLEQAEAVLSERRTAIEKLQRAISELTAKGGSLEDSINTLQLTIKTMQDELDRRDAKIRVLDKAVADLIEALASERARGIVLKEANEELEAANATIWNQLIECERSAWFVVGTDKELREAGIISVVSRGLFGKERRVRPSLPEGSLTKIDLRDERRLRLGVGVSKFMFVSRHDDTLAHMVSDGGTVYLDILDPERFWKDKVLVIRVWR